MHSFYDVFTVFLLPQEGQGGVLAQGLLKGLVLGTGLSWVNQTPENMAYTQFWLSIDQL